MRAWVVVAALVCLVTDRATCEPEFRNQIHASDSYVGVPRRIQVVNPDPQENDVLLVRDALNLIGGYSCSLQCGVEASRSCLKTAASWEEGPLLASLSHLPRTV